MAVKLNEMAHQNLFEALERITGFTALESDLFEIIDAVDKDRAEQNKPNEMKTKKTAVDWLIEQITNKPLVDIDDEWWFGVIGEAKQLEKQQAFEFWQGGINCTEEGGKSFQEYHTENYGEETDGC